MNAGIPRIELAPGYTISRVIKGGWQLAGGHGPVDQDAALDDMQRFVDAGVTTFDCADIYTGVETLIGVFLARVREREGRAAAERIQVHTKYVPDRPDLLTLTRHDVEQAIDRSLRRLGMERLDLVQFHWWDYDVPRYADVAGWLGSLQQAGKIRLIGLTNFDSERVGALVDAGIRVAAHQVQYSVLDRRPTRRMAGECEARGIGLLCYGALAGGLVSRHYLGQPAPVAPFENRSLLKYRLIIEECGGWSRFQTVLHALDEVATRQGTDLSAVALRWVLDQPGVAGVIVGARHARHLASVQRAVSLALAPDDRAAIDACLTATPCPPGDVYDVERIKDGEHAAIMRYTLNRG